MPEPANVRLPRNLLISIEAIAVLPAVHSGHTPPELSSEHGVTGTGTGYGQIMASYRNFPVTLDDELDRPSVFAPFAGTEGYTPVVYAPYIAGATIGRLLRLDFPEMLLLMRLLGLAAFTAVAAYAIAVTPIMKWPFVLIALLPVSLYNRSVLSADGAALSAALAITAVCLKHAWDLSADRTWERSLWMTLCALSKQPQIVFMILELTVSRLKELPRRWTSHRPR